MGSVKDLRITRAAVIGSHGLGEFVFTDKYSVFDWGQMPDTIAHKGAALNLISSFFFEQIEAAGILTHYDGLVDRRGKTIRFSDVTEPLNIMKVRLYTVPGVKTTENGYDYRNYYGLTISYVIPVEFIYRNTLPEGSSVFKRLQDGKLKPQDLGLKEMPKPGDTLPQPFIEYTTKLEKQDRPLSEKEMLDKKMIYGLQKLEEVKNLVLNVNKIITKILEKRGFVNNDGKVEVALDENGRPLLIDAVGTPDENRFTYKGIQLSKEIIRHYYRKTDWYNRLTQAKAKDPINWKSTIKPPPPLPEDFKRFLSDMYQVLCNHITGRKLFNTSTSLNDICKQAAKIA